MRTGPRKRGYRHGADPKERFWSAVDSSDKDGCWPWTLGRSRKYGVFKLNGNTVHVHRLACFWSHGQPPPGAVAIATCRNKLCCNPKHLKWGPRSEARSLSQGWIWE